MTDWIGTCVQCISAKGPQTRSRGTLRKYSVGTPFEHIAMNIAEPFLMSTKGNKYVLGVIDCFREWPAVYPLPNQEV